MKYNWKLIVVGDPCGLHTIEMNKHVVSRFQGKKQNENPSIFSKAIAVLFPNIGNISKYKNVHNFHFNGVMNSFSLCMTVGVVSVILSMICLFTMFLTECTLLKHRPWLGKAKATLISRMI